MGVIDQIGSAIASGVSSTLGGLPGAAVNFGLNTLTQNQQVKKSKELMKYQWDNFLSPEAQVRSMASAGLNPAVTLGGHGSFASPNAVMPSSNAPIQVDGVSDMLGSLTQLKKVDKENELVDQEIYKTLAEKGLIDEQRHGQVIANTIAMEYGDKEAAARIANLGAQASLYASQEDLAKAEKTLTVLKGETEKVYKDLVEKNKLKAALEVKNYQRYIDSVIESNRKSAKLAEAQTLESGARTSNIESDTKIKDLDWDIRHANKDEEIDAAFNRFLSERNVSAAVKTEAELKLKRIKNLIKSRNTSEVYEGIDDFMSWLSGHIGLSGSASLSMSSSSTSKK